MKEEIKYLYKKKDFLNISLYTAHLKAASEWGNDWELIRNSIHETLNLQFEKKYKNLDKKLSHLANTQIETDGENPTFFPRIVNKTDISFSNY